MHASAFVSSSSPSLYSFFLSLYTLQVTFGRLGVACQLLEWIDLPPNTPSLPKSPVNLSTGAFYEAPLFKPTESALKLSTTSIPYALTRYITSTSLYDVGAAPSPYMIPLSLKSSFLNPSNHPFWRIVFTLITPPSILSPHWTPLIGLSIKTGMQANSSFGNYPSSLGYYHTGKVKFNSSSLVCPEWTPGEPLIFFLDLKNSRCLIQTAHSDTPSLLITDIPTNDIALGASVTQANSLVHVSSCDTITEAALPQIGSNCLSLSWKDI